MSQFCYTFPVSEPTEEVTRKAFIHVDGQEETELEYTGTEFDATFDLDQVVSVSIQDTDAAGNSTDRVSVLESVTIVDNVPPASPSASIAVKQIDAPVADEPAAEGEVVDGPTGTEPTDGSEAVVEAPQADPASDEVDATEEQQSGE